MHFIGIDPHKDTLAACAVDPHGRPVAHASFPNDPAGHADLVTWALAHRPDRIGVEGAGGLGRQATLALRHRGLMALEVPPSSPPRPAAAAAARPRPTRSTRC